MAIERVPKWRGDTDTARQLMDVVTRVLGHTPDPAELRALRLSLDYLIETTETAREDEVFHGDGYSVRRLTPDEARRRGLDAAEPSTGAIYYGDDDFQAALDVIPLTDAHI